MTARITSCLNLITVKIALAGVMIWFTLFHRHVYVKNI